jgi:hypothetical protein
VAHDREREEDEEGPGPNMGLRSSTKHFLDSPVQYANSAPFEAGRWGDASLDPFTVLARRVGDLIGGQNTRHSYWKMVSVALDSRYKKAFFFFFLYFLCILRPH